MKFNNKIICFTDRIIKTLTFPKKQAADTAEQVKRYFKLAYPEIHYN